jgi:hypothetical protein
MIRNSPQATRAAIFGMEEPLSDLDALAVTLDRLAEQVEDVDLQNALTYGVKNLRRLVVQLEDSFKDTVNTLRREEATTQQV